MLNPAQAIADILPPGDRVAKIDTVVRMLASAMLGSQETRIVRFTSVSDGRVRWLVEVEAFVPNPELTIVNRGETRTILERRHCEFSLDENLELVAFAPVELQ